MIDKNIYTEISEVKLLGHGVWGSSARDLKLHKILKISFF